MGLIELATRRRVTVAMVTLTFMLFGLIALRDLKVNLLPDLSYPTLTVRTEYTGAAPAEVETLITEPVEQAVGVVKNLRKLKSVSRTGQSDVVLEFAWGTDMDQASLEVRDKLELLQLPLEVKPPVLLRFNPSTQPIMRLVIAADGASASPEALMALRRYADETLKRRLEPVEGVAAVKVGGGLEDEVQVLIDQDKLAQLNLDVNSVVQRLQQENVNISGGRIEEGTQRYLVRTVNQFATLQQMRDMLVGNVGGVPVHLRDVATVEQGHKEREAIIRIGAAEAVEIAIYKEGDANTVAVATAVKEALRLMEAETAPKTPGERRRPGMVGPPQVDGEYTVDGMRMRTVEDQSVFIRAALSEVQKEAVLGGIFAILIIFFFLRDGWSTFVISLSLPVSIIATFFFMGQLGLSLNVMSLAGLALATGMVVDDSIVVLESIAKARERGLGVLEAALVGTREVGMPVVATTLTTVAVFLPLVFVEGVAGQLFKDQALTVSIALLISMVVALSLIPMLSSLKATAPMAFHPEREPGRVPLPTSRAGLVALFGAPLRGVTSRVRGPAGPVLGGLAAVLSAPFILLYALGSVLVFAGVRVALLAWRQFTLRVLPVVAAVGEFVLRPYERAALSYRSRVLPAALNRPGLVLGSAGVAFLLSLGLATTLGTDLIPQLAQDRFEMTAKLPPGTPLKDTDSLVAAVQGQFEDDPRIQALFGVSGTGTRLDANPTESGENIARVSIVLGQGYSRGTEAAITEDFRGLMAQYPGVEVKFSRPELVSLSTPLEVELRGTDLGEIEGAARRLRDLMAASPKFADVKSTVQDGFPEVQIVFDQERAADLGLTTRQIADEVVRKVRGEVATRYSFRDRKIDVLVRASEQDRASVAEIRNLIVNPRSERPVPLSAVAEVRETIGPSEINRVDQTRVAIISANLRDIDLGTAIEEVNALVDGNPLGADIRLAFGGQSEELGRSLQSLLFAFALAIFLVYLVMASQFESLLHPFVILFTIPLAVVGAVLALFTTGAPVSVVVFIGLILLVGIVVKNAIVLVDKVNQLRLEGVPKREALVEGSYSRLRPIIMTTLTTLFGFAPLAFMGGEGAEVKAPMALTVIGGLTVSTLLTLVVIPVMYDLLDRRGDASWKAEGERHRQIGLVGRMFGESSP
ncbi:MAG: efflux RND transporter permease subunit [Lysobacteraceae bacterium]|jgi:HAE1 family hydrophobic/amphiphilic exporter-1|nr:efflux RND transporter permease subunit [Xanthomonadaceae bacterium]MCZ8317351.1 efflux RND transporter permease subunit [Silanimonas sp.]